MIPETNHDVEISIYLDFLEDQGIIVDRDPEEQDQWIFEVKITQVGGMTNTGSNMGINVGNELSTVVGGFPAGHNVGDRNYGVNGG